MSKKPKAVARRTAKLSKQDIKNVLNHMSMSMMIELMTKLLEKNIGIISEGVGNKKLKRFAVPKTKTPNPGAAAIRRKYGKEA